MQNNHDQHLFAGCAGAQGPFSVNLWFKSNITDNTENLFAYLLSALANASQTVSGGDDVYAANSLQLMLPEVLYTVVSNNMETACIYLRC